ncbi:MAG: O-antigen ligase family protein [Candidatus Saccharimonadales bacterium]
MDKDKIKQLAISYPAVLITVIILLLPFHAFITVWGNSLIGHYTLLRLWKEFLLIFCVLGALIILIFDKKVRQLFYQSRLVQLIIVFFLIEIILGIFVRTFNHVTTKALFYGWLSDCRYLLFFIVTLVIGKKTSLIKNNALRLIMWPAVIVIIFGILQVLVLPHNFLAHFGYSHNTIPPYQTINSNKHYVRIISTLRGSNPLGAYLLIPLTLLAVLIMKKRRIWQVAIFIAGAFVLFFSFSRSAWIGLVVVIILSTYLCLKSLKLKRLLLFILIGLLVVASGIFIAERNNHKFQNLVFHTQSNSSIKTTSDQGHVVALKNDLKQLFANPLGKGPGTAGPASVYNKHNVDITENYYLQIGIETGWLGFIIFLAINLLVALSLWRRRSDTLSLVLFISFIGLIVCNLFLEAWTDDTLCYIWWGLAGIAIAAQPQLTKYKKSNWIL